MTEDLVSSEHFWSYVIISPLKMKNKDFLPYNHCCSINMMTSVSQFIRFGCFRDEDALVWYLSVSRTDSRRNKNTFFSFEMYLNVIFLCQDGKQDTVVVHFNVYYKRFGSPKSKSVNILHSWLFFVLLLLFELLPYPTGQHKMSWSVHEMKTFTLK